MSVIKLRHVGLFVGT